MKRRAQQDIPEIWRQLRSVNSGKSKLTQNPGSNPHELMEDGEVLLRIPLRCGDGDGGDEDGKALRTRGLQTTRKSRITRRPLTTQSSGKVYSLAADHGEEISDMQQQVDEGRKGRANTRGLHFRCKRGSLRLPSARTCGRPLASAFVNQCTAA